jgi:ATP-dependent RNA helicase RhlB
MQFSEFNLSEDLQKGIVEAGYAECTEVQHETLVHTLTGKDVFVQSQTGTGKTAAFLISLFELIERGPEREKAIIISPTRELAVQIAEEAKLLSLYLDFNIVTMFGGVGYNQQLKAIADGIDILIGTPGRLIDMSNRRMLNLHQFNYVVIDEADRMFDMGFVHDIQTILYKLPSKESRQTMLFSATLTPAVKHLASGSMKDPVEVHIVSQNVTVDAINQQVYHVGSAEKMSLLLGLLKKYGSGRALIFVNMKHMAEEIADRLKGNGYKAEYLTGDLAQGQRQRRIDQFKNNELPLLIATDVAARGIHVDDLELVINYDIPMHSENYVHRIGRTARAGKTGHAITLACETFVEFLAPIEKFINMKLPSTVAEDELYLPDLTAGKNYRRKRRPSGSGDSGPRRSGSGSGRRTQSGNSRSRGNSGSDRPRSGNQQSRSGSSSGGGRTTERSRSTGSSGNRHPSQEQRRRSGTGTGGRGTTGRGRTRDVAPARDVPTGTTAPASAPKPAHERKHVSQLTTSPQKKAATAKKKGLFSRVISLFK